MNIAIVMGLFQVNNEATLKQCGKWHRFPYDHSTKLDFTRRLQNFQPPLSRCVKSKLPGIKLHDVKQLLLILKFLIAVFKSSYLSEIDIRIWQNNVRGLLDTNRDGDPNSAGEQRWGKGSSGLMTAVTADSYCSLYSSLFYLKTSRV